MANQYANSSSITSNDDGMNYLRSSTTKLDYFDESKNKIYVVRESKFFQNEWFDLKRPKCFKDLDKAQNYVESKIDEIKIKRMFEKEENAKVERLASSMTWYYTMKTESLLPIIRFEIYLTNIF